MGYITKDIAKITEPKLYSLSGRPNFVQFESKPSTKVKSHYIIGVTAEANAPARTYTLNVKTNAGRVHSFRGSLDPEEVSVDVFYISSNNSDTAQNIANALSANDWISANFDVLVPFNWDGDTPQNGLNVNLISKGYGVDFNVVIEAPNNVNTYQLTKVRDSQSRDSITGEASTVGIETVLYINPQLFLGAPDEPNTVEKLGTKLTTLSKIYASGSPVWFDVNAVINSVVGAKFPSLSGWSDAGTGTLYRFISNVKGFNSFSFYQSSLLLAVNGYAEEDLTPYVYGVSGLKPLSNMPANRYRAGQIAFFNFIYKDKDRGNPAQKTRTLSLITRAFSSSGELLGTAKSNNVTNKSLKIVNTCAVDLTAVLDQFPTANYLRVALAFEGVIISGDLVYEVFDDCPATLHNIIFLNSLGGWDCLGMTTQVKSNEKVTRDVFDYTVTPSSGKGLHKGTVITETETALTLEAQGIGESWKAWASELINSKYIYTEEGKPIILTESELSAEGDLMTLKIKYND